MSIYCSIFDIGDEHLPRCKRMKRLESGLYGEADSQPCTCGSCPIRYQGSHVFPSRKDKRDGVFSIAAIPSHVTRTGHNDGREGMWHPWLRISMHKTNQDALVLTRRQVEKLRDTLNRWLEKSKVRRK